MKRIALLSLVAIAAAGCAEENGTPALPSVQPDAMVPIGGGGGSAPVNPSNCVDVDQDGYGTGPDCRGTDCDDTDNSVNPGAVEQCDGADNDCNGAVDDNIFGPDCSLTGGVCAGSRQKCEGGDWTMCSGVASFGPDYEAEEAACDGVDNDCDGRIDEGCPCNPGQSQPCGNAAGECQQGVQNCADGTWGACEGEVGPTDDTCDGRDNDCDGDIDEEVEAAAPDCELSEGVCAGAKALCAGQNGWSACGAAEYGERWLAAEGPDACDGVDNDCDGRVDEECECQDGDEQPCGTDVGACAPGVQVCSNGQFGDCREAVEPRDEECDGRDNDCDGNTDEDLAAPACPLNQGVCTGSTQGCGGPDGWNACTPAGYAEHDARYVAEEGADHCDGVDNDCDGQIDEGCECENGASQPCGENVGQCTQGEQSCVGGRWTECSGTGPGSEVCDGIDNDCDGTVDEGVEGPECPLQDGLCGGSRQQCVEGAFADCGAAEYGPLFQANETFCDRVDNDCDGDTDENCACVDNDQQPCGSNVGACTQGQQTCVGGQWAACEDEITPVEEVCNGIDDNCNEEADEGLTAPDCGLQVGVCAGAKQRCGADAGWIAACGGDEYGPTWVAAETDAHCDGQDNDCDGSIDEECECQPEGERPVCGSDVGACQTGLLVCEVGVFTACEGEVPPAAEICDGLDNDCDGDTDEELEAPLCENQVGVCVGSRQLCGGDLGFVACVNEEFGADWVADEGAGNCDGRDNDCDGMVDEGCPAPQVVISEIHYNGPGADGPTEFIELAGAASTFLNGMRLEAVNGNGGEVYATYVFGRSHRMPFNGYFLVVDDAAAPTLQDIADAVWNSADLQNGPDSLRLMWNDQVLDAVAYGEFGADTVSAGEGNPAPDAENASLTRDADNTDTNDNATDFVLSTTTPAGIPTPGGDPIPRIHLALRWDMDATDMDLHFIHTGGDFNSDLDVYYANRSPLWPNHERGDPRLDRDDVDGLGPEFIDYVAPREGVYLVEVHYFSAGFGADPSNATVGIFVDGQEALSLTANMNADSRYWAVAEIVVDGLGGIQINQRNELGAEDYDNLPQP
jgi:hypothetical protein